MKRRFVSSAAALGLALSGATAVVAATPASAACSEVGNVYYSFSSVSTVWKRTSLSSSYVKGPGSVTLTKGRTWNVQASMTATVSAEAGVVFAKASTSLGITVGAGYSGTQSFAYTLNVPRGETKRLQQYKAAKRFVVTKKRIVAPCSTVVVYRSTVTAPVKSTADRYFKYALVS
ncbi:hypothetical protein [Terrabacter terrigena]|uniref:Tat pathway signal sequence domain protein n=1 Tax=Terrabacter terrigena TaxID=574718 RepID=A0ABW3MYV8_9MICO